MNKSLAVVALFAVAGSAQADLITWNFGAATVSAGGSISASAVGGGLNGAPSITRTNGNNASNNNNIVEINSVSSGYAGASGTGNGAAIAAAGAFNAATSTYFGWTITPAQYTSLAITQATFGSRSTSTGPLSWSLRSSADSYGSSIANNASNMSNGGVWALQNAGAISQTVTATTSFRLYGFGGAGTSSSNNWRIDDLNISYNVLDSAINAGTPVDGGTIRRGSTTNAGMAIGEVAGGSQASTTYSVGYSGTGGVSLAGATTGSVSNGAVDNRTLVFGGNTAGAVSGTFTVTNTGNAADVQRAGANHEVTVTASIVDPAQASFNAGSLANTLLIDFGTVNQNDVVSAQAFIIANLQATLGFTAGLDVLAGGIGASGDTGVLSANLGALTNLAAGSSSSYNATFDTSNLGSFSTTYTITGRDAASVQGGAANDVSLTLTIVGTVVPTPGSAALIGLGALVANRRRRA